MSVEFVSYSGAYPNLCAGTLVLCIDGVTTTLPNHSLVSGGTVWFDDDWCEHVECGPWSVDVPPELEHLKLEIERIVNMNVSEGCCGGCI